LFGSIVGNGISCLRLFNNTCGGQSILCSDSGLIVLGSVFESNRYEHFVGSHSSSSIVFEFIECVFDVQILNKTGSASVTFTDCLYTASVSQCSIHTRNPTPTRRLRLLVDFVGDECPGCGPTISTTTTFWGCTFDGCSVSGSGAAIYLSNSAYGLGLFDCVVIDCYASSQGGAIHAEPCQSFSLQRTSGLICQCGSYN
jgi:hypothetical protein